MSNTTDTFWEIDGVSLQTHCQNVESLAPKFGTRTLRGGNVPVAYKRGQVWRPKQVDQHALPLGMWVTGKNTDGTQPLEGMERKVHENMTALQGLTWNDGTRQVELTKKWHDPDTGVLMEATALAEPQPWEPEMRGPHSAKMVIDFLLAEPYFYGPVQALTIPLNTATPVVVAGDVPTSRITLNFNGQLTTPILTNATPQPDVWVKVGSAIASGDDVFLDVEEYTAARVSDSANLVGAVTRSGARNWMALLPGTNTLTLTASAGAGTVDLTYAPAYL